MYKIKNTLIITLLYAAIAFGCATTEDQVNYDKSIRTWHQLRIDSLKGETGFLNLAGLYWLSNGITSFGSDNSNMLDFTSVAAPVMGSFLRKDSLVYLIPEVEIKINGEEVLDTILVFNKEQTLAMEYKSLHWFIIKRGENIGVRLRDYKYPLLQSFDSIDYFTTNPAWRLDATWITYDEPKLIPFSNVLNMTIEYPIYGAFRFSVEGEEYQLEPLGEPGPDGYFLMFYDKTSGHSTYGSGRYLYVEEPDASGHAIIDFNKSYNPPCAFTEHATCLFPHKENRLPIFIKAGEKFSGH